jgi:hypothetical protein
LGHALWLRNTSVEGTCPNCVPLKRKEIEEKALSGLKNWMMSPEMFAAFIAEFNAEVARI